MSPCTVAAAASAFILSTEVAGSSTLAVNCLLDFLIFVGGTSGAFQADRYCGERFSPAAPVVTANAASVCCKSNNANSLYQLIYFLNLIGFLF